MKKVGKESMDNEESSGLGNKIIINSVEPVKIKGKNFPARIDTGATRSSISKEIVNELTLGPVISSVEVRNAHGKSKRDVLLLEVLLAGAKMKAKFNVSDRSKMKYPILVGRNILKRGFLVDCSNESRNN